MKGYKGFDKDLKCSGKQYAIGREEVEEEATLMQRGLHFCELPHHILKYYKQHNGSRYCEVEASEVSEERGIFDSIRVAKKIKVKREISVFDICKKSFSAFFDFFGVSEKIEKALKREVDYSSVSVGEGGIASVCSYKFANSENFGISISETRGTSNTGDYGISKSGSYGIANAGDYGVAITDTGGIATAGNYGAAKSQNMGIANAAEYGVAEAGHMGIANAGISGTALAGNYGTANAGRHGVAVAGDYGLAISDDGSSEAADGGIALEKGVGYAKAGEAGMAIVNRGRAEVGKRGIAVSSSAARVKGDIGSVLFAAKRDIDGNIYDFAACKVDGEIIKANTWYVLFSGKFEESE